MTARRASTVAVTSVVAATLLVVLLAAWASSIGPGEVLRGNGPERAPETSASSASSSPQAQRSAPPPAERRDPAPWVRAFALLVDLAVVVGLAVLAAVVLRRTVRGWRIRRVRRRRVGTDAEHPDFDVLPPGAAVAREMQADAAQQRELLLEGGPRNAVVACWHRFETQAGRAGLERRPWETSSEYTMRVLDLVDAHEPAVARLAALYREARFSEHELTEEHRREALAALDAIHGTIQRTRQVPT